MNPAKPDTTANDARRFDLLVDGELSAAQRRELLERLDEEPGAWKRCALAFLEAQAWREELGAVRDEASGPPSAAAACSPPVSRTSPRTTHRARLIHTSGTLLAMAASFLMAMVLGWWVYRPGGPLEVAEDLPRGRGPAIDLAEQAAPRQPGSRREAAPIPPEAVAQWRWVTLGPEQGVADGVRPVRLPAVESEAVDEAWLRRLPAGVPAPVLDALRQAGHRVRHQRQLIPFPLEDGRSLLVPVDEVDVRYVGDELYR